MMTVLTLIGAEEQTSWYARNMSVKEDLVVRMELLTQIITNDVKKDLSAFFQRIW